jgi:tripartite-type tricarboxylate transporter receptor subunit TctC
MRVLPAFVIAFAVAVVSGAALAQAWPAKPVTLVVPSSAGGTPDVLARILAIGLTEQLGQQVVVMDRPGASGNIGSEAVVRAAPDGYTVLMGSIVNSVNPHLMKVSFSLDELAPVSSVAAASDVLTVHPTVPVMNLQELIGFLKANPDTPVGYPGLGSTPHLSIETFRLMTGLRLTLVPYQGGGAMFQGLLSKQVPMAFATTLGVIPRLKSGQLRGLAISSAKRVAALPDMPTVAESGLPGFEVTAWFGVFAPARTPKPIIDHLSDAIRKAVAAPDIGKRLVELGAEPLGSTPEDFRTFVQAEFQKWGRLVIEAGIRAE